MTTATETRYFTNVEYSNGRAVALTHATWEEALGYAKKMKRKEHVDHACAYDYEEDYLKQIGIAR